jgi:hypothetical protein
MKSVISCIQQKACFMITYRQIRQDSPQKGFGATHPPDAMPEYDFRFASMADMAEAHRAAVLR